MVGIPVDLDERIVKTIAKNRRLYEHGRTSASTGNANNQHLNYFNYDPMFAVHSIHTHTYTLEKSIPFHPLRLSRAARRTGHPFRDSHLYGVSYLSHKAAEFNKPQAERPVLV